MRAVIQRVTYGKVSITGRTAAEINAGLVILLGIEMEDTRGQADALAKKIANLRIFSDTQGKMNLSVLDIGGGAIVAPHFPLMADPRRGNRPSFTQAAPPESAIPLVDYFCQALRELGVATQSGEFGADMLVEIHNDGPVTILLDF